MRKLLLCGALLALLPAGQAWAYEGPWCAVLNFGSFGPVERCSMPSFEACREEALHYGSSSFCRQNGRWPGYWKSNPPSKFRAHKKKHRHHHS